MVNDVGLRPMMTASPNDVWLRAGEERNATHHFVPKAQHITVRKLYITSNRCHPPFRRLGLKNNRNRDIIKS
ncbi:MAG: hypothetical protein E7612_02030 [Ruminococcaceae bacterium]|nr:hypothetical protein [Oscillospiraceae bacterium]